MTARRPDNETSADLATRQAPAELPYQASRTMNIGWSWKRR